MSILPYYLAIGMPYDLFWNGEPELTKVYRKAHEFRTEQRNQEMWVQGIYVLRAFQNVIEKFGQAMSGKSGGKVTEYPQEPLPFTENERKAAKERNKQRTLLWVEEGQH